MPNKGKHKKAQHASSAHAHQPAKPPQEAMIKIPNPLPVQIQPSTEDNQRHGDEKDNRNAHLRAAQRQNHISIGAGIIAFLGLVAVYISIWQSRSTFQEGQRAWVLVVRTPIMSPGEQSEPDMTKAKSIPLSADTPGMAIVVIKNTGLSPALKVETRMDAPHYIASPACKLISLPPNSAQSVSVMGPGQVDIGGEMLIAPSRDCLNAINRGEAILLMTGSIAYEDIFHHKHINKFCYQYGPREQTMVICNSGNETD
jgi:hypothetical protein